MQSRSNLMSGGAHQTTHLQSNENQQISHLTSLPSLTAANLLRQSNMTPTNSAFSNTPHTMNDPFVGAGDGTRGSSPDWRNIAGSRNDRRLEPVTSPLAAYSNRNATEPRSQARENAEFIMSGGMAHQYQEEESPHGANHSQTQPGRTSGRNNSMTISAIKPEQIADPPFLENSLIFAIPPSLQDARTHIPFVEPGLRVQPSTNGIIVVTNIPYNTTKPEIVAALGRNARLISQPAGSPYYAIHIIMERSTGKTMDAYVELESIMEAQSIVKNYERRLLDRPIHIGERQIEMSVCSQAGLMKALFPRARCVKWNGQVPEVYTTNEPFNSGFNGFMTSEEIYMLVKHAETPQRSPFASRSPNRTYECLISTLHKHPWFSPHHITLGARSTLFNATASMICALANALRRNLHPAVLTPILLHEVTVAAITNPGFSIAQRTALAEIVAGAGHADMLEGIGYVHLGALGATWPFEALGIKSEVGMRVVEWYVNVLRHAAGGSGGRGRGAGLPFGAVGVEYGVPRAEMGALTMDVVARREWDAVEGYLRMVLS